MRSREMVIFEELSPFLPNGHLDKIQLHHTQQRETRDTVSISPHRGDISYQRWWDQTIARSRPLVTVFVLFHVVDSRNQLIHVYFDAKCKFHAFHNDRSHRGRLISYHAKNEP